MEEVTSPAMERKKSCPRKLDLNAPFLSTRRQIGVTSIETSHLSSRHPLWDTCNRVPFSWEQAPGKRKDGLGIHDSEDMDVPPPRLPPCRWRPAINREHDDTDDGCDGDVDDDYNKFNEGDFSDAIDLFSLSESVDMFDARVDVDLGSTRDSSAVQSPSFIIQRYLSDAKALAAASSAVIPRNSCHVSRKVGESYSSPKSCGLDMFFPWRMKHKLCGVKSPVKPTRRKHKSSLAEHFNSCQY